MAVKSPTQPQLSVEELQLVTGLLERERADLRVEIHHTSTPQFRDELKRRLELVTRLLDRLKER
jgi:hypothetical protein